jgi:hypothetical protein
LPIENCPKFAFQCPKQWSQLVPTAQDGVKHCGQCNRNVFYCATIDEARTRAKEGSCVALDLTSARWPNDLAPPFGEYVCRRCNLDAGSGNRQCPRCGEYVEDMMIVGEMA